MLVMLLMMGKEKTTYLYSTAAHILFEDVIPNIDANIQKRF